VSREERSRAANGSAQSESAFSILVPAYNAEETLGETLESLLDQTRMDWEAIVVDDGSTDATRAVAASFARRDSRIRVVSKQNGGTASARNLAAEMAHAPLLCLLDADDMYMCNYLERMGHFIDEHPDFDIYSCTGYFLDSSGNRRPSDALPPGSPTLSYTVEDLLVRNHIWVQSVLRASVLSVVGRFDEEWPFHEDYEFWLRALLRGARHILNPEPLWIYRVSPGSKSADPLWVDEGNRRILDRLIESGELSGRRRRIARRGRALSLKQPEIRRAQAARRLFESNLLQRQYGGLRQLYRSARLAYVSVPKYVCGWMIVMVSPRLFAQVWRGLAGFRQ